MEVKEYYIKTYSISRFIISFIIIECILLFFLRDYIINIENHFLSVLIFIGIIAGSLYLSILIGRAKIKIVFTKEAFLHIWETQFLFSWQKDISIPWGIVNNYVFEEDRAWDSFIINLSTKTRYKINRLNILPIKDDFDRFIKDFPHLSNKFKKEIERDNNNMESENLIAEGKSKYESKSFRQSFYILLIAFLILLIIIIFNSGLHSNLWLLGAIAIAIGYYWLMIKMRKNR